MIYCNNKSELDKFSKHFVEFVKTLDINNEHKNKLLINKIAKAEGYGVKRKYDLTFAGFVNTKKTFNGLYIDNKDDIMTVIDKFTNGTMYPSNLHLDNKLGILLHGPPGTGKSGFISCLANKLGRSILLIDSMNIDRQIILDAVTDNKKTHIIVLDEIDKLLETFDTTTNVDLSSLFSVANEKEKKEIIKVAASTKKKEISDVAFLMLLLDSFGDDTDRVFIAATNYPEKIPASIVRPGRIDKIICLTYCSMQMFTDLVRQVYDNIDTILLDDDVRDAVLEMLKLNVTPLIVINTCVTTTSFNECLAKLQSMNKQNYDGKINE